VEEAAGKKYCVDNGQVADQAAMGAVPEGFDSQFWLGPAPQGTPRVPRNPS
jgi:hypothetical protein